MADVVNLVPRSAQTDEDGNGTGDVPTWLRALADRIESGDFGTVGAAVLIVREDDIDATKWCVRMRKCNMHVLETIGTLKTMLHDVLN